MIFFLSGEINETQHIKHAKQKIIFKMKSRMLEEIEHDELITIER